MIKEINPRHLNLIRGGAPAAPTYVDTHPAPKPAPPDQRPGADEPAPSKLSREVMKIVKDAYCAGLEHGEAQNFRAGWRWGLVSGMLAGALWGVAATLLVQWMSLP